MTPQKKIRFGVLGYSRVAKKSVIPALLASEHAELVMIGRRSSDQESEDASDFVCETGTYDQVLARRDIDAVYISLPNALHAQWVVKAAEAGKHVWCEKPCALSYAEAKRMIEVCERKKTRLMEGFMFLFHTQHKKIREMIDNGEIGELSRFDGCFAFPYPTAESSLLNAELGGGSLNDSAVYPIRASRMIFNNEPISVFCSLAIDAIHAVDTKVDMFLSYPDDRMAHVASAFGSYFQSTYTVTGSTGRITAERAYAVPKDRDVSVRLDRNDTSTQIIIPAADQFLLLATSFCEELLRDSDHTEKYESDILAQSRILDAARKSHAEKRTVLLSEIH